MKISGRRKPQIAVLESELRVREYITSVLTDRFRVNSFGSVEELDRFLATGATPDLLIVDWLVAAANENENARDLLARIRTSRQYLPILVITCWADPQDLASVSKIGAIDFLYKPFRKCDLDKMVDECLGAHLQQSDDDEVKEIPLSENVSFVRSTKRMQEIESQCRLVGRADIPVLILGESGTGKEVAAMLIHQLSARSQKNFLKVNCAAMPADLLESELFGYEQGAFTGAVKSKPGKFELCDNGTIFLDEIGEMPAVLQAKLLQVLQDGSFSRLGSRSTVKVNVRVIAATNIDVKEAIARKLFREDLYYRLNGFTLKMPPLRERSQEIPVLAAHFMRKVTCKYECEPLPISPTLMRALTQYSWPGNLRELENTIKRYLVLRNEKEIIEELAPARFSGAAETRDGQAGEVASLKTLVKNLKGNAEATAIVQSLNETGWNRKAAANDLKISYKALLYKIRQYNLNPPANNNVLYR